MLSIGAMSSTQANYYLGLAQEDYYLKGGEPEGEWHGGGIKFLDLDGRVDGVHLRNMFKGMTPAGDRFLTQRQRHEGKVDHRPGWDLTFSAPKSVSVLWSQLPNSERTKIADAHAEAVKKALDFVESSAGLTRRGKGGKKLEKAGLIFATFEHGTSRAQDPQLHTHCLLMNISVRQDGTTGTVSSRSVFQTKMTAGSIYRTELSHQLQKELGVKVEKVREWFEIVGVDKPLIETFSKRRKEIESQLEARGIESAKGAAAVTLETRSLKESKPRSELFSDWQEIGKAHGWSVNEALGILNQPQTVAPERLPSDLSSLTERKGFFHERDAFRYLSKQAEATTLGATEVIRQVDELLKNPDRVTPLGNGRFSVPHRSDSLKSEGVECSSDLTEERIKKFKEQGYDVIGIAPDKPSAIVFGRQYEVKTYSLEEFIAKAQVQVSDVAKFIDKLKSQKSLSELLARGGPNILAPFEKWLKEYSPDVSAPFRKLANEYGPDIGQVFRYALSKLDGSKNVVTPKTAVFISEPDRMSSSQMLAIMSVIDVAHAKPTLVFSARDRSRRTHKESPVAQQTQAQEQSRPKGFSVNM